jgi:hypothetical protein
LEKNPQNLKNSSLDEFFDTQKKVAFCRFCGSVFAGECTMIERMIGLLRLIQGFHTVWQWVLSGFIIIGVIVIYYYVYGRGYDEGERETKEKIRQSELEKVQREIIDYVFRMFSCIPNINERYGHRLEFNHGPYEGIGADGYFFRVSDKECAGDLHAMDDVISEINIRIDYQREKVLMSSLSKGFVVTSELQNIHMYEMVCFEIDRVQHWEPPQKSIEASA